MHRNRPRPRGSLRALAVLASALASCSVVLDFGTFRFGDDAGVDAAGDVSQRDATGADDGLAAVDLPATDIAPAQDVPPAMDIVPTPDDVPAPDAAPADVPDRDATADAPVTDTPPVDVFTMDTPPVDVFTMDVAVDRGPADVAVDRGPVDTGPPDVPFPAPRSCVEVLSRGGIASGTYAINHDDDPGTRTIQVYCDQVREGGGWLRVIDLFNGTSCPAPLTSLPTERVCARTPGPTETVSPFVIAPVIAFREVRGRAALRGRADLDAFGNAPMYLSWESAFVDGLTVSRVEPFDGGTTRVHVFSWAITASTRSLAPTQACPCLGGMAPLAQVGNRYLCRALVDAARDAGAVDPAAWRDPESPWVVSGATCAAGDPDGWFRTDLGTSLRAPLDVRLTVSGASGATGEEVGVTALELYVR